MVNGQELPRWELPKPLAVREAQGAGGAPILLRRHGNRDGPRLVVSHANGLAADSYHPYWSLLCDRFDLILYDFRNHGWNPVGELGTRNMSTFVRDNRRVARAIDRHFGDKPKTGVFHSMSAVAAVLHAVRRRRSRRSSFSIRQPAVTPVIRRTSGNWGADSRKEPGNAATGSRRVRS